MSDDELPIVANPATGEQLDRLDQQPAETLAEALAAIQERQTQLKEWGALIDDELRRRLQAKGRKLDVYGDWEVELETPFEYEWDSQNAKTVLQRFIDDGVLRASECVGVIKEQPEVIRSEMNKLLSRLAWPERRELEEFRHKRPKGRGRLRVTRSVSLAEAAERALGSGPEGDSPAPAEQPKTPPHVERQQTEKPGLRYWGD